MIVVIPMAGRSTRFSDYDVHKALLPIGNGTMLSHIIGKWESLDTPVIVVVVFDPGLTSRKLLEGIVGPGVLLISADSPTKDPLDAVGRAWRYFLNDEELAVNYVDCWLDDSTADFIAAARERQCPSLVSFDSDQDRFDNLPGGAKVGGICYFPSGAGFLESSKEFLRGWGTPELGIPGVVIRSSSGRFYYHASDYRDAGVPEDYERLKALYD